MLELEPPGPDPELSTTTRHDVERGDAFRQQRRVPIGIAGDQRGQTHPRGVLGECGEQCVALDHRLVRGAEDGQLVEVVHHQNGVEPGVLRFDGLRGDGGEELVGCCVGVGEVRDLVAECRHLVDATPNRRSGGRARRSSR
ncbi:Uncharacterised protein [Mycobacteroides abscessus subsp. abscessus]|nr:Uncharacterised protein [Mycobacteroides abscessus subsp. abscessus]